MIKKLAAEWIGIIYQKVVGQRHDFELTLRQKVRRGIDCKGRCVKLM
jgi:hypothetical protein